MKGSKALFSSESCEWGTPQEFFDNLNAEFHFTLDPCSTDENAKCEKHYTKEDDGLAKDWSGEIVFCNPPYGRQIQRWVLKCYLHSVKNEGTAVMLLPARTDTKWFHDYIYGKAEIRFLKGRIKYIGGKNVAPFPSMVVVYRKGGDRMMKRIKNADDGFVPTKFKMFPSDIWACGNCGHMAVGSASYKGKYCPECGRKVKWDG